jgi:hypothetical protein
VQRKFSINKHVILIWKALNVPGLLAHLYSLHQHCDMPACNFFSYYDCGTFPLFPSFSIKIDDSKDSLVNFKAIGTQQSAPLDDAEPCNNSHSEADRPAHDMMSKIDFSLPNPKAHPSPHHSNPPSLGHILPDTPSPSNSSKPTAADLDASAIQPLSKHLLFKLHKDPHNLPEVPPAYTLGACEKRTQFDN